MGFDKINGDFDEINGLLGYEKQTGGPLRTRVALPSTGEVVSHGRILAQQLDHSAYLWAHYHLRYQVYCHEQRFLSPEDYPEKLEIDEYDTLSTHFGVFLDEISPDRMIATSRLVQGDCHFPLHDHCAISPKFVRYFESGVRAAEISRLMISRAAMDNLFGGHGCALRKDILIALYKAMYRWVEAEEVSLLFAAMEPPLVRILRKTGFPFLEIGPQADYYGRVFPYVLDIEFGKQHMRTREPEMWRFLTDEHPFSGNSQSPAQWIRPQAQVA